MRTTSTRPAAAGCDAEHTWTLLPSAVSDAPLLFLFTVNTVAISFFSFFYPQGVISKSPLLFHTQIPAEVISGESVAPEPKLNIPVFIRSRLKHCRGSRSQRRARLVREDIRRVLFPVLRIENPCCVLFNPSAAAVSKVHRGCIFSGAGKQPGQLPSLCPYSSRSALPSPASPSTQKCHCALRHLNRRQQLDTFRTGRVESPM